jgi:hypothetical protein
MGLQQGFAISGMGLSDQIALQRLLAAHVAYGSTPAMAAAFCDVRFYPASRH